MDVRNGPLERRSSSNECDLVRASESGARVRRVYRVAPSRVTARESTSDEYWHWPEREPLRCDPPMRKTGNEGGAHEPDCSVRGVEDCRDAGTVRAVSGRGDGEVRAARCSACGGISRSHGYDASVPIHGASRRHGLCSWNQ